MLKKYIPIAVLVIGGLILSGIFVPAPTKKVDISTTAFMYTADEKIGKPVATELRGNFNKEDTFQGVLNIEAAEFPHVIFVSGMGLVSYQEKERELLGPIYYDPEQKQFAISIDNPRIYEMLTGEKYSEHPLIVVTSARDLEEAKRQYEGIIKKAVDKLEASAEP